MTYQLRPEYQLPAHIATIEHCKASAEPAFHNMSVGAGKTINIAFMCQHVVSKGGKVLVLARQGELIEQNADDAWSIGVKTSIFSASLNKKSTVFNCVMGTEGTVSNHLLDVFSEWLPDCILIDECHMVHWQDVIDCCELAESQRELIAEQRRANAAQAAEKTQKATQQQFIVQRAVNALGGVQSALETIVALPEGSTTGWLPNLQTKDGMFSAVRNQLGRKISSVDAEFMNTLFSGIGRNLASIEASGTATGLTGLANQLQSGVYINAGVDDPFKVAMKLADIRRIATENIRPSINSGLMPKQQAAEAQRLVEQIEKIIPYTTLDVANAYRQAKGGARQTISGSVNRAMSKGSESTTYDDAEKEARYQKWLKENPQ